MPQQQLYFVQARQQTPRPCLMQNPLNPVPLPKQMGPDEAFVLEKIIFRDIKTSSLG